MLAPPIQPVVASRKKTSRNPSGAGVTSCQNDPPSVVRRTSPPPTKSKPPTAKAVRGSIASRPLKVKSENSSCSAHVLPPSVEGQGGPRLPPKKASAPPAHPFDASANATAKISPKTSKPCTVARIH